MHSLLFLYLLFTTVGLAGVGGFIIQETTKNFQFIIIRKPERDHEETNPLPPMNSKILLPIVSFSFHSTDIEADSSSFSISNITLNSFSFSANRFLFRFLQCELTGFQPRWKAFLYFSDNLFFWKGKHSISCQQVDFHYSSFNKP